MKTKWHRGILRLVACGLLGNLPAAEPPEYRVTRWTTEDGLPENTVRCLQQTSDGYIWIGTFAGLARFDGVRFVKFNHANTPALVDDAIASLAEDPRDRSLWIGTGDGLARRDGDGFHRYRTEAPGTYRAVYRIKPAMGGGVWFNCGAEPRVLRWRPGGIETFTYPAPPVPQAESDSRGLVETAPGRLRLFLGGGVFRFDVRSDSWAAEIPLSDAGAGRITAFQDGSAGELWLGTADGLFRRVEGGLKRIAMADGRTNFFVNRLYRTRDRLLFADVRGKAHGLYLFRDGKLAVLHLPDVPETGYLGCIQEDEEGNLWLGTDNGLIRMAPRRLRVYTTSDGLPSDEVYSVHQGPDDTIWVGTRDGLGAFRGGGFRSVLPQLNVGLIAPVKGGSVWADRRGRVWCKSDSFPLLVLEDGVFQNLSHLICASGEWVKAIHEDRAGRMWFGLDRRVVCYHDGKVTEYPLPDRAQGGDAVLSLEEDHAGAIWVGTRHAGLKRLVNGEFTTYAAANEEYRSIHEDTEGVLWIGTDNGLNRLAGGRFFVFTTAHGLPEPSINDVLEDEDGFLWLSGLSGIARVSRRDLNEIAAGRRRRADCTPFGQADGMLIAETSSASDNPAAWKTRDGELWFPTKRGLVVIDPKAVPVSEPPPPVLIERVVADDEVVWGEGAKHSDQRAALTLAPGRARVLKIAYTANSLVDSTRNRFKYRLEGLDAGWRDAGTTREALYTNLRPGKYTFQVTACNNHGFWQPVPRSLAFFLAPSIGQTWWYPWVLGLAGAASTLGFVAWRLSWQRRAHQAEKVAALAEERSRLARDLHDDLGASLTGLALELEAARRAETSSPAQLATLADEARNLALSLRELSWTSNPRCDNLGSLGLFLVELTDRLCAASGLECRTETPEPADPRLVPAGWRHDLLAVAKESLANIIKHAQARVVRLRLESRGGEILLEIADDGRGYDSDRPVAGSGLRNLRERVERAGGVFTAVSAIGGGTRIEARIPMGPSNYQQAGALSRQKK